jgi:hypothetical protein
MKMKREHEIVGKNGVIIGRMVRNRGIKPNNQSKFKPKKS